MKAIEINEDLKDLFLKACELADLEAEQLKKMLTPGRVFFRINNTFSQHDIFRLGVIFGDLVSKK